MKPPDDVRQEQVRQWLAKAEQDYALMGYLLENKTPFFSAIGFHAQQAVEKLLKALLTQYDIEFPKTHSITRLLNLLATYDRPFAESLMDTEILSAYGVESRYPGDLPDLSEKDALDARNRAEMARSSILIRLDIQNHRP